MSRWGFKIFLAALLSVVLTMGARGASQATESLQPDWGGLYDITINTAEGLQVPAEIEIRDLGNGQVEVSGVFREFSVNQMGEYSGDVEGEGLKANFDINQLGLVRGNIDFIIHKSQGYYCIQGQGSATSFATGRMAGTFSGQRRETESAPPTPAPAPEATPVPAAKSPNYLFWAAGAALLILAAAITARRRQRGNRR